MPRGEALTLGRGGAQRGQIVVVFTLCYDGADESTLLTDGSEQVGVGVEPVERFALNVFTQVSDLEFKPFEHTL